MTHYLSHICDEGHRYIPHNRQEECPICRIKELEAHIGKAAPVAWFHWEDGEEETSDKKMSRPVLSHFRGSLPSRSLLSFSIKELVDRAQAEPVKLWQCDGCKNIKASTVNINDMKCLNCSDYSLPVRSPSDMEWMAIILSLEQFTSLTASCKGGLRDDG